jgi:hypothetical protein
MTLGAWIPHQVREGGKNLISPAGVLPFVGIAHVDGDFSISSRKIGAGGLEYAAALGVCH